MIIGEDLKEASQNVDTNAVVLPVESHGGFGEGDNTEGAIAVLESATEYGVIPKEEAKRQIEMLKLATKIEKTRGMAQGDYIKPNFGDSKEKVAKLIIEKIKAGKNVVFLLNAKKETAYLFADVLNVDYSSIWSNPISDTSPSSKNNPKKPMIIANLDENIGLPRIKNHARNIKENLRNKNIAIDYITGGLDEYPITGKKAEEFLKNKDIDLIVVAGVPHALKIENLDFESVAITDGPRLVEPLRNLGYNHVVAELDAHSKTLGTKKIVDSDFGVMLRTIIEWENDNS
jgi:putative methanogenesis marker 13 metalloprotein